MYFMLYMVQYYGTLWYWYGVLYKDYYCIIHKRERGNYKVARETTQRPFILLNFHEFNLMFLAE